VGGDIAYANNFPTCYRIWDRWLAAWEANMVTPGNHAIPMAVAIGNHEANQWGPVRKDDVPFYFSYFAQQRRANEERVSYHHHAVGEDVSVTILDTNHVARARDQAAWLREGGALATGQQLKVRS